ncbi:MAG: zinc-ribbon and DUF3426 domain-containing protein [Granulosicoccus sp.]
MVTTSRQAETTGNPQTCCSNCRTVFEVTPELLSSTDTRVRCGECLSIFDALANLREDEPRDDSDELDETSADLLKGVVELDANAPLGSYSPAAEERALNADIAMQNATLAGLSNDTGTLDVTYSDFDLFSEEADLPEVAYFDQTHDTPEFDFDAVEIDGDETFSDTMFAHDVTVDVAELQSPALSEVALLDSVEVDFIVDETQTDELVFNYDERARSRQTVTNPADGDASAHARNSDEFADPTGSSLLNEDTSSAERASEGVAVDELVLPEDRRTPWVFRIGMGLLLLLLTGALFAYRSRDSLAEHPVARPIMQAACRIFDCVVPERVDLDSLKMLKRNTYSHPTVANALVIELAFVNNAEFAQPYPVLEVRMTSRSGRLVAKRDFTPKDYLSGWQPADTMASGKRLDISLEVKDPGESADSFLIYFRKLLPTAQSR